MSVGQFVAGDLQIGPDGAETLLGEIAQPGRCIGIGAVAEVFEEVRCGGEDFAKGGQDAVMRSGESVGDVLGGFGFADAMGYFSDLGAQGKVVRLGEAGFEGFVALDVIADGAETGDGPSGEPSFLSGLKAGRQAALALVEAGDLDEAGPFQKAVGFRITAAGKDLIGVNIAPQGQDAVGQGQVDKFLMGVGQRVRRMAGVGGAAD
ncbi:hypothetical protein ACFC0C_30410 [Streptomyces sp. NPDC056178]|uniref:hypothetical protein n=1 Tax=Streptomyces sp. NPDC056178 TaxID=3345735 RepID=UPI0035D97DC6